jgi:hypothetical protein
MPLTRYSLNFRCLRVAHAQIASRFNGYADGLPGERSSSGVYGTAVLVGNATGGQPFDPIPDPFYGCATGTPSLLEMSRFLLGESEN